MSGPSGDRETCEVVAVIAHVGRWPSLLSAPSVTVGGLSPLSVELT